MAFIKGISGNSNGRPKGIKNVAGGTLRTFISQFLEEKFEDIKNDFDGLEPKDRFKIFIDLLQYSLPRLQATTITADLRGELEDLSDQQLEDLATRILELENSHQ